MAQLVWEQAREAARKVLDGSWDQRIPVNVEQICRACGVTTYKCVMPYDLSGMIVKRASERDAKAFIDKEEPGVRQRFILAHELGHFIERTVIAKDDEYGFGEGRMYGRREKDYFRRVRRRDPHARIKGRGIPICRQGSGNNGATVRCAGQCNENAFRQSPKAIEIHTMAEHSTWERMNHVESHRTHGHWLRPGHGRFERLDVPVRQNHCGNPSTAE